MSNPYDDKEQLMAQARQLQTEGKTNTEISKILDVPRKTIYNWIGNSVSVTSSTYLEEEPIINEDGDVIGNTLKVCRKYDADGDDVLRFLEQLAPVQYPAPTRCEVKETPNKFAVVIGDLHFADEHQPTVEIFYEVVRQTKPEQVILNGDTLDMFAISGYPKDIREKKSLEAEIKAYHKFLKILHDITEPFGTKIFETNANHSGNSQEGRWWRYLSSRIGEAASVPEIQKALAYDKIFYPDSSWNRVKLVDEVVLPTNMIVKHGTVVRKKGGQSAVGEYEKVFASTITNHVHRFGATAQRHPAVGNRKAVTYYNYENACACDLNPSYVKDPNWQNGFSIVNYTDVNEECLGVDFVAVHDNIACVNTLQKTIKV
jgi:hypothetical protein